MYDTVLVNGLVIDPGNSIMSKLNVCIKDGKIARITAQDVQAQYTYDCKGLVISPGFVDIHIHEDSFDGGKGDFILDISQCLLRMGVTTGIGGNCGEGPLNPACYLNDLDRLGYPINLGLLAAHESLRRSFGEFNKYEKVSDSIIRQMCSLITEQLESGCLGLSFGVRYIPGVDYQEMEALCREVSKLGGIVSIHMRDDAAGAVTSLVEAIRLGRETGARLQISHIGSMAAYGQMEEVYRLVDEEGAAGMDIYLDCYPYTAFCTSIGSTTFDQGFLERYRIGYSSLEMTEGLYKGERCTAESFNSERNNHPEYLVVGHVMREEEVDFALTHPRTMVASDGILHQGNGHPRAAGTFPKFIREYVYEKRLLSLYDAVYKAAYQPAARFSLAKGTLSRGADADIVIFNPLEIRDQSNFLTPTTSPSGIEYVFVNGRLALERGRIINHRLGKAIRRTP